MAGNSFHQLYYHYVWSTKNREPEIVGDMFSWIMETLNEEAHTRGGVVLASNAMPEHIHLLVTLPPTIVVATYVGQIKGYIAFAHNKKFPQETPLVWQEGYGVLSLARAQVEKITTYIENQQEIHATRQTNNLLEQSDP